MSCELAAHRCISMKPNCLNLNWTFAPQRLTDEPKGDYRTSGDRESRHIEETGGTIHPGLA